MPTDDEYLMRVRAALIAVEPHNELDKVFRRCRGAFPGLVAALAAEAGIAIPPPRRDHDNLAPRNLLDKLPGNPILCSWYFTDAAVRHLTQLMDYTGLTIAFMGCPTVFSTFCQESLGTQRVLFDADSLTIRTVSSAHKNGTSIHHDVRHDIDHAWRNSFDVVFFDPPWYPDDYYQWLCTANALARTHATIAFALLPELTRPEADRDRRSVLRQVAKIDRSSLVVRDILSYAIPTFERRQLEHAGLHDLTSWKRADLVVLRKTTEVELTAPVLPPEVQWTEVTFSSLRVFVQQASSNTSHLLVAAPGGPWLASPSRRDQMRAAANVLTSDGRAFITRSPEELMILLRRLMDASHGECPQDFSGEFNVLAKLFSFDLNTAQGQ